MDSFLRFKSTYRSQTLSISICLFVLISPANAAWDSRHALIIGNSDYTYALPLDNPRNDSADMAKALEKLYFKVTLLQNATKQQTETAVQNYINVLKENGGVGLFFYAGHGVQLEGNNYLVPIEANVGTDREIKHQSFDIARLLEGMREVDTRTNIIILDACRDNPFKHIAKAGNRSLGNGGKSNGGKGKGDDRGLVKITVPKLDSGLNKLDAPPNTLIAFATAPGRVARDGEGRNSPYTSKLIEAMQSTGLTIAEVFREVRADVVKQTNGQQVPWESSSLIQDFYFKPRASIPVGF